MQKTVVIDGDFSLLVNGQAECELLILDSGEAGVFTTIRDGTLLPRYTGETTVTPKAFLSTVLETANKSVYENIEVLQIPYVEVSNESGGYTVSIG